VSPLYNKKQEQFAFRMFDKLLRFASHLRCIPLSSARICTLDVCVKSSMRDTASVLRLDNDGES